MVTNYYDKIAHFYDQTRWLTEPIAEDITDFILELVDAKSETSFLEPGVGTGLNILPLVKRGYSVTGIDAQSVASKIRLYSSQFKANLW